MLRFDIWINVWHSMCGYCSLKIWFSNVDFWNLTREVNLLQFQMWFLNFDSPNRIMHICLLKTRSIQFKYCKPDSLRSRNWSRELDIWKSIREYWCSIWWLSTWLSTLHLRNTMFEICFVTSLQLTETKWNWSSSFVNLNVFSLRFFPRAR